MKIPTKSSSRWTALVCLVVVVFLHGGGHVVAEESSTTTRKLLFDSIRSRIGQPVTSPNNDESTTNRARYRNDPLVQQQWAQATDRTEEEGEEEEFNPDRIVLPWNKRIQHSGGNRVRSRMDSSSMKSKMEDKKKNSPKASPTKSLKGNGMTSKKDNSKGYYTTEKLNHSEKESAMPDYHTPKIYDAVRKRMSAKSKNKWEKSLGESKTSNKTTGKSNHVKVIEHRPTPYRQRYRNRSRKSKTSAKKTKSPKSYSMSNKNKSKTSSKKKGKNSGKSKMSSKSMSKSVMGKSSKNGAPSFKGKGMPPKPTLVWDNIGCVQGEEGGDIQVTISSDGYVTAVGFPGPRQDILGSTIQGTEFAGVVRVYQSATPDKVVQIGSDIPGIQAGDEFGRALDLNGAGTVLAVGAPGYNNDTGAIFIYFYDMSTGLWTAIDSMSGSKPGDRYGASVAIDSDGTTLVIGAPGDDAAGLDAGRVILASFSEADGLYQSTMEMFGSRAGGQCGSDVSISALGEVVAYGCPGHDDSMNGENVGSILAYDISSQKPMGFPIFGEVAGRQCGYSIDLAGDGKTLIYGCPGVVVGGCDDIDDGSVTVVSFVRTGWRQLGQEIHGGGSSVAISGNAKVISVSGGAVCDGPNKSPLGSLVTLFSLSARSKKWLELGPPVLIADDPYAKVDLTKSGRELIVGSSNDDDVPNACVFRYRKPKPPTSSPTEQPSATGPTPVPTDFPTIIPTTTQPSGTRPTSLPTVEPSASPTRAPTVSPTLVPTGTPPLTSPPTSMPTEEPTQEATEDTSSPTDAPTSSASSLPSSVPSSSPTFVPTQSPPTTASPTTSTRSPTTSPSIVPSNLPSKWPSEAPSTLSSETPSDVPSELPSETPSKVPSEAPSSAPSKWPSESPSSLPSLSAAPTTTTQPPTSPPSDSPSQRPSDSLTPSQLSSQHPTLSLAPTGQLDSPSQNPTVSVSPTLSLTPTGQSDSPSQNPTVSAGPTLSLKPTSDSDPPSQSPTVSSNPTTSISPSSGSTAPTLTGEPTTSKSPSISPTTSTFPSILPTNHPTEGGVSEVPSAPPTTSTSPTTS
eukprot:scaffold8790_cov187-Amphora_coffeaeformis.AAC.11